MSERKKKRYAEIIGTGACIPPEIIENKDFLKNRFYGPDGKPLPMSTEEIIRNFESVTGIKERRIAEDRQNIHTIGFEAAEEAISDSGIDREKLDYIIVGHNFGHISGAVKQTDQVPTIAARIKHALKIKNPKTIAYDLPFGCPGWLQGMIQANYFIRSGDADSALVIGAEILSRIADPFDRDSMIYADGAGAALVQGIDSAEPAGIISHAARSDTYDDAYLLWMGPSYNPDYGQSGLFLKMDGYKVYEYALKNVPLAVKESLDKAGLSLMDIQKVLLHQANEKLDQGMMKRLFKLYGIRDMPYQRLPQKIREQLAARFGKRETYGIKELSTILMPLTVSRLGNSSVATLPTLLHLMRKEKLDDHRLQPGDTVIFASLGAGMNINAMIYKMPGRRV